MSTQGHIVYENQEGQFLMRWHFNDAYIINRYHYPGLGKILIERFNNEEVIKKLFELNRHFCSIVQNEKEYKESVTQSIERQGIKKHNDHEKIFYDKVSFLNEQAIKMLSAVDDNLLKKTYDSLEICLKECELQYVYLYKQSDKSWHIQVENTFIPLKNALYIKTKYENILITNEEIGFDDNKTHLLKFKISKCCFQLLNFVKIQDKTSIPQYENFLENHTRKVFDIEKINNESKNYELYLLNKNLNKVIENKPYDSKKLKI